MSYEDEKNIAGETGMPSSDEQIVSRLLSDLKRVDAPRDFDFHLKARIANASPADYRPVRFFPVLKYAMPLALFLVAGAAFVLTNSYTGENMPVVAGPEISPASVVADPNSGKQADTVSVPTRVPENILIPDSPPAGTREFVAERPRQSTLPRPNRPAGSNSPGGSYDSTQKNSPAPISRRGVGSNSNLATGPGRTVTSAPLEFRQMLMRLGIDASDAGQKTWKVNALTRDGIAARSGLRVGDLMEAIDGKPIDSLYDNSFSVSSISVRRDGKTVRIDLKP